LRDAGTWGKNPPSLTDMIFKTIGPGPAPEKAHQAVGKAMVQGDGKEGGTTYRVGLRQGRKRLPGELGTRYTPHEKINVALGMSPRRGGEKEERGTRKRKESVPRGEGHQGKKRRRLGG